jgi:hypothetical protein
MRISKVKIISFMLLLAMGISMVSAQTNAVQTVVLAQNAEAQTVGGISCGYAWGLGLALAIGTLSPCGVLCATAGWYMLLTLDSCTES